MRFLALFITAFFLRPVLAQTLDAAAVAEKALAEADSMQLAQRSQWLALLHFKNEVWTTRFLSQVDDARFFLSADGKTDARAELQADIRAFFQPSAKGHAQCLFPARWFWLKQQLDLPDDYDVSCPRFEKWFQSIPADRLTLVFPAMYLNNPGSSFGHTYLRFDNSKSVLLSHSLNYAAATRKANDSLPVYVYNGLFGGYRGVFGMRHYFETVQEYSNLENRDIWEYTLDYSPEEIRQLARHVWEVLLINLDYYFFNENCSYRLLALLDVLREGSQLSGDEAFPLYVIPVDTVRVLDQAGVIVRRKFRPSLATRLQTAMSSLPEAHRAKVLALADATAPVDAIDDLALTQQATKLDAAYNLLQFRQQQDSEQAQAILSARSQLGVQTQQPDYQRLPPEKGHASARFGIAVGQREQSGFMSLRIRPAFHDLLDDPAGYVPGAAINVFETELRVFDDRRGERQLRLQQLSFINIRSLAAVSDWYRPVSWSLDVRLQQQPAVAFAQADDFISFQTRLAAGLTFDMNETDASKVYALALADIQFADELDQGYTVLSGLQLGWLLYGDAGQFGVQLEALRDAAGHKSAQDSVQLQYQYNLQPDSALRLSVSWRRYPNDDEAEWGLGWLRYF